HFDREEAAVNQVKAALMAEQNPPAIEWLMQNLPPYFTDEVAMMATFFCPMRVHPEYVMKQLKEHYGPQMHTLKKGRVAFRLNGAPRFEMKSDGSGGRMPYLMFDVRTSDTSSRRGVYYFEHKTRDASPTEQQLRFDLTKWYEAMVVKYYGNVSVLPGQKPDGAPKPDL